MCCIINFLRDALTAFYFTFLKKRFYIDYLDGTWAIVTGAGDGLGKAYVHVLGKKKIKICLIGRTLHKLQEVARDVESKYGVETLVIQHNFDGSSSETELIKKLSPILGKVSILINNAGTAGSIKATGSTWTDLDMPSGLKLVREILKVNVDSAILMTSLVLPYMKKNNSGAIVFVSSIASEYPVYATSAYCASKVCLNYLADGIHQSLGDYKINILIYRPFYMQTNIIPNGLKKKSWKSLFVLSPNSCAEYSLKFIGHGLYTYGHLGHSIQNHILASFLRICPKRIVDRVLKHSVEVLERSKID